MNSDNKISWGQLATSTAEEFQVTGTHTIDLSIATHEIVLTGATVFSISNPPPQGQSRTITVYMSGNFGATLPPEFSATYDIIGELDLGVGKTSQLVIEAFNNNSLKYFVTINNLTNV